MIAEQIENAGRSENLAGVDALVLKLKHELEAVLQELPQFAV